MYVYSAHFMKPKLGSEEEPQLPTLAFFSSGGTLFDRGSEARNPPPLLEAKPTHTRWGLKGKRAKKKKVGGSFEEKKGGFRPFKGKKKEEEALPSFLLIHLRRPSRGKRG